MLAQDSVAKSLDLILLDIAPGRAAFEMMVRPDMLNALKLCHGGTIFALAEAAFLYAANSHNRRAVTQQASISHIAPAVDGDVLIATARELAHSSRAGHYSVEVRNAERLLIADFRAQARFVRGEWVQAFAP